MSHKQSTDMLLTVGMCPVPSAIHTHLIMLLRGENGYCIPVCEITKGKMVSPEQSKRVLWKYEKGLGTARSSLKVTFVTLFLG